MTAYIFFVNQIPFFLTLSREICFTAVNHLSNRTVTTIFKAFEEVYKFYLNRGFHVSRLHVDGEFAPLNTQIQAMPGGPRVNLTSANEHVPEIKRRIRVVKERARSSRHSPPLNRIPRLLTVCIVFKAVKHLNYFPPKGGISDIFSPRTIMTGETLNYKTQLNLCLGQYCQVHEEGTPRKGQHSRAQGGICVGPSGNQQGGFKFMSLATGQRLLRRTWDILPMPNSVVNRVNTLPKVLTFTDRKGRPIGDIKPLGPDDDLDNDTNGEIPGVDAGVNHTPQVTDGTEIDIAQPGNAVINPQERIKVDIVPDIVPDDNSQAEQPHQLYV
jgi:hypothetical protein